MHFARISTALACVLSMAVFATAQRVPARGDAPRIENLTPNYLETGTEPTQLIVGGQNFARKAEVRIRTKGDRGSGIDYPAVVENPTLLRLRIPADLIAKPTTLELRVKHPDGVVSDWVPLEVRARSGNAPVTVGGPVIDRITPTQFEARSRDVYVTIYGKGLVEGAEVEMRGASTTSTARGRLANGTLVVRLTPEILAQPQSVSLRVRGATGVWSDTARFEVVSGSGSPGGANPSEPFISRLDPQRIDMRGARSQTVELIGTGIDRERARVLLRPEGSRDDGTVVPVTLRTEASNGIVLGVELTTAMVRNSGAYELRVVNPNGRQSNWVRLEVEGAAGPGDANAAVDVTFPRTVTLTAVKTTVPVEVRVRNEGRSALRVGDFEIVRPDGSKIATQGSLDVPAGAERTLRLEAPVSLSAGAGSKAPVKYEVALAYKVGPTSGASAKERRSPSNGFETVSLRNEIPLVNIGREIVRDDQNNALEGWRFFKSDNPANEDAGKIADFYLFGEQFATADTRASEELFNYRPRDAADPNLFFLVLRLGESSQFGMRGREQGTRLGYVAVNGAPGLVPLYRWVKMEGRRAANHFLSTSNELDKLPRQIQQQRGWRLDTTVGYVVPRT